LRKSIVNLTEDCEPSPASSPIIHLITKSISALPVGIPHEKYKTAIREIVDIAIKGVDGMLREYENQREQLQEEE